MRRVFLSCFLLSAVAFAMPAKAAPKVTSKTTTFPISGASGGALLQELERRGPKQGFTSRAIAQTRYTMNTEADWSHADGVCAVTKPKIRLDITYIYPRIEGTASSAMKLRWAAFMSGIRKHEEIHGSIAREMASEAHRAVAALQVRDGSSCARLKAEMKRVVAAIVARHETRQRQFDAAEHRGGGNIDGLVRRLVKQ